MLVLVVNIAATLFTAAILAVHFWGFRRKREEERRWKQGEVTIPIDAGYMVASGCLGVLGYMGLLFILVSLTLDLFEVLVGPGWLNWVIAFALIAGFFAMVGWAVFGIGSSFAVSRPVVNKRGIRLMSWRRTKTAIYNRATTFFHLPLVKRFVFKSLYFRVIATKTRRRTRLFYILEIEPGLPTSRLLDR